MKREHFDSLINHVICCDLVSGERPVAKLIEVTDDHVVLKDPYIYIPVPVGSSMQVQALAYGAPLYDVKKLSVGYEHIIALLNVQPNMEQAYIRQTSGLVTETKPSIIVP